MFLRDLINGNLAEQPSPLPPCHKTAGLYVSDRNIVLGDIRRIDYSNLEYSYDMKITLFACISIVWMI